MGRKRSEYICPKCGLQGSLRYKWTRNGERANSAENWYRSVEHYNSATSKKTTCYVEKFLKEQEFKTVALPDWDFILLRGFERIELTVKKWERRIKRMLQIVTSPEDRERIQSMLGGIRDLIYFEEVPYLLVHVLSHKGKLNQHEDFVLNESKKYLVQQTQIKKQLGVLRKLPLNKKICKFNTSDKRVIAVAENSVQAFQFINDPFFRGLEQWYRKYGKKVKDQKTREWKKKLSEGLGSYKARNPYSGILYDD